jgi:ribosomal protein L6P/L9E
MRDILKTEELEIPEGVTVAIKARVIVVTGPRGTLTKNVQHVNMDIKLQKGKKTKVLLAVWQGGRKHVACLRTIKSLIQNMITGVTKVRTPPLARSGVGGSDGLLEWTGLFVQDAHCLRPFPDKLHHPRRRTSSGDP